MSVKSPKVSIIMPTYNRAHLIEETLDSILNQSHENWECLIIDDRSTDSTKEILQPYLEKDARLIYIERSFEHKKGPSGCRNQGLKLANGNYIIFFDSDDIIHPDTLKICLNILESNEIYFCRFDKAPFRGKWNSYGFDNNSDFDISPVNIKNLEEIIIGKLPFACCTVMWNKKSFENHLFNENLSYAEEWEFYNRILSSGISGISINKILYYSRKHPNSNTGQFWNNDPIRRNSKVKAVKLVINNLQQKELLSSSLVKYFIQTGFFLKDFSIIDHTLKCSKVNFFTKLTYKLGYMFYPLIRPVFKLKGKLKKKVLGT